MKLLILIFTICLVNCYGQTNNEFSIGKCDSLSSKILHENRKLWIYLPDNYTINKKYPVAYLLDGETNFHSFTGVVSHLSNSYVIPEMIVVGIININRNKDYTPTHDFSNYDKSNGGGELFSSFFEKELIPYINSHYATTPYNILIGHSLGGLFALNILLKHSGLFNSYIAIDPSLWWDKMKLNNEAIKILVENKFKDKCLFLSMSNSMPEGMTDIAEARKDTTYATVGIRSVLSFYENLQKQNPSNIRWNFIYYDKERHGSIPLISEYDGLKFIFDFYQRPSFQKITDSTVIILEEHYKMISSKMHYTILPPESDINGLAWRSMVLEKNPDRAFGFLELYIKLYPQSANAYLMMGDYFKEKNNLNKAKEYYDKGIHLTEVQNIK